MSVLEVTSSYKGNVSIMYDTPYEDNGLAFMLNAYIDGSSINTKYGDCVAIFEDYYSAAFYIDLLETRQGYDGECVHHYIVPAFVTDPDNPYMF
jgi:hypothetical protein